MLRHRSIRFLTPFVPIVAGASILLLGSGCGQPKYPNAPAQGPQALGRPYVFDDLACGPGNTDELFVCLTFSGGGTRAAALAYGVLAELRDTPLQPLADGRPRRLLDEVDVISSVSGGSFTALAYKKWGEDLFNGAYAERFLYHNVTRDLVARIITQNLLILPLVFPDRIHIAADYMNERVFDQVSYTELSRRRPFVVVNATSMTGHRFEFTQDEFDVLGSDLDSVPLGHAAMASSAYPLLLSPMRLRYYRNERSAHTLERLLTDPRAAQDDPRRCAWANELVPSGSDECVLDTENHRFIYLLDGGVRDNLGLSYVLRAFRSGPIRRRLETQDESQRIRRLVVIVVDAVNGMPDGIERRRIAPGLLDVAGRSAAIGVASHSETTLDLARCLLRENHDRIVEHHRRYAGTEGAFDGHSPPEVNYQTHLIEVRLANVADPATRERLLALPTRLDLDRAEVDELIAQGRTLLRGHAEFAHFSTSSCEPTQTE